MPGPGRPSRHSSPRCAPAPVTCAGSGSRYRDRRPEADRESPGAGAPEAGARPADSAATRRSRRIRSADEATAGLTTIRAARSRILVELLGQPTQVDGQLLAVGCSGKHGQVCAGIEEDEADESVLGELDHGLLDAVVAVEALSCRLGVLDDTAGSGGHLIRHGGVQVRDARYAPTV